MFYAILKIANASYADQKKEKEILKMKEERRLYKNEPASEKDKEVQREPYYGDGKDFLNRYAFVARALCLYQEDYIQGNLPPERKKQLDEMREWGWQNIRLFGLKTAHKMMAPYPTTSHHFYDVEIDLYEVYCNKITVYDATKGTPTTFFVRYFRAAIREFILFTWHHLNSYDMQNYREISKAIEFYEQRRIAYTPEMLATKTGMSVKIVTSTLKYVEQSHYADIDDATNQRSSIAGPEESYLNKEREEILIEMINSILSDKEKLVYYTRVNLDGNKNMPFEKVAETLNMPLKEVKRLFNSAICRLSTNPDFLRDFGGKRSQERKRTADNTIRLHQNLESKLKEQGEYLLKKFKNK